MESGHPMIRVRHVPKDLPPESGEARAAAVRSGQADCVDVYARSSRGLLFAAGDEAARLAALEAAREGGVVELAHRGLAEASADLRVAAVAIFDTALERGLISFAEVAKALSIRVVENDPVVQRAALRVLAKKRYEPPPLPEVRRVAVEGSSEEARIAALAYLETARDEVPEAAGRDASRRP